MQFSINVNISCNNFQFQIEEITDQKIRSKSNKFTGTVEYYILGIGIV